MPVSGTIGDVLQEMQQLEMCRWAGEAFLKAWCAKLLCLRSLGGKRVFLC